MILGNDGLAHSPPKSQAKPSCGLAASGKRWNSDHSIFLNKVTLSLVTYSCYFYGNLMSRKASSATHLPTLTSLLGNYLVLVQSHVL